MKKWLPALLVCSMFVNAANAQNESPLPHFEGIVNAIQRVNEKYLVYMSTIAHSNNVRKAERKRQDLLEQIDKSRYAIADLPLYKSDRSLAKATTDYFKLMSNDLNENYAKIVNLEEIAEQSYDNMEAYLLLRKRVAEKMKAAGDTMELREEEYCKKYNITLSKAEDEMSRKMQQSAEVSNYNENIYLIFFKCSAQETELMKALDKKNVTSMEQIKSAMVKYANEGLAKLDTTKNFGSDPSLKAACKRTLEFFKKEADKMSICTDFIMKEESFEQIKKAFQGNASAKSNKDEIDKYNKAVNELNNASNTFNQNNDYLNKYRADAYKDFNEASAAFLDSHMPYAK